PASLKAALRDSDMLVRSKSDLQRSPDAEGDPGSIGEAGATYPASPERMGPGSRAARSPGERWVSVVTGDGVAGLLDALAARVTEALGREEAPVLTRVRHRRLVEEARAALDRAIPMLSRGPELAAEDVRVATHAIGRLTGRIDVEDLLDEIFSSFCIGK
ncbi:MAG: tRNA uridine-5-carboxymethylaminomethyl(34) synthesis GTPase MnmE, partial [Proteobacteria bacterium]|nr:tRNA uridine-5-carboxymethylaminomethyl(34) synthesis GTPase MnmE [Pseudomonadota bacterium]